MGIRVFMLVEYHNENGKGSVAKCITPPFKCLSLTHSGLQVLNKRVHIYPRETRVENRPQQCLGHVEGLSEGMCSPHYLITIKMVTDWIHLEFGIDEEKDGGDEDVDVERLEEALVLTFWEDGYLLLPTVNSNTPLEMLKQVLRVYVWEIHSKCSSYGCCASLTIVISEFQKLSGRIPWVAIWANHDTHVVKKCQQTKYALDDPS